MRLYVEPMDAVLIDVAADGRIRLENEEWSEPTLQERRAIIYAATLEREALAELLEILESTPAGEAPPSPRAQSGPDSGRAMKATKNTKA